MNAPLPLPIKGAAQRNVQNDLIASLMLRAAEGIGILRREGYTVLRVELADQRRPLIWIQPCGLCEQLGGKWYRKEHTAAGDTYTWQASVSGCRVQWQTHGGAR